VNLETGTIRSILRRNKVWANIQQDVRMLAVRDDVGHAISHEEEDALLAACLQSRSRSLYPAVMLALNTGMRYSEIRLLQWKQVSLVTKTLIVGKSKTATGTGRAIFLNARIAPVLAMWAEQFPKRQPSHYLFPFEKYGAAGDEFKPCVYDQHPDRPVGDWKEAWEAAKRRTGRQCPSCATGKLGEAEKKKEYICCDCGSTTNALPVEVKCRFHDLRHTAVTRMLEAGVPYSVVATVMGWSAATAIRMAKRYGHIGQKTLVDAMAVLERAEIASESPKNPPKSANEISERVQ
jgi:integrase